MAVESLPIGNKNLPKKTRKRLTLWEGVRPICIKCGSETTYIKKNGTEIWHKYKNGWMCHKCRHTTIDNPKRTYEYLKKYSDKNNVRILIFKNKHLYLKTKPRKGKCELCGKKVGEEYINSKGKIVIMKQTNIHHIQYHDNDPLKDTVELCVSCHNIETTRLEKIEKEKSVEFIYCGCGCGFTRSKYDKGIERKFINGHNRRKN